MSVLQPNPLLSLGQALADRDYPIVLQTATVTKKWSVKGFLTVTIDGTTTEASLPSLVGAAVGDQVQVLLKGGRALVIGPAGWIPYTPVVTSSGTQPNPGNAPVIQGAYEVVGGTVTWRACITTGGAGIAAGTGGYFLSIPLPPIGGFAIVGTGWIYGAISFVPFILDQGPAARLIRTDIAGAQVASTEGFTAGSQVLSASGTYQIA